MKLISLVVLVLSCCLPVHAQQAADKIILEKTIASWRVACRQDAMTDRKSCAIFTARGLMVILLQNADPLITMLGKKYPSSPVFLRLDEQPALTIKEPGWRGPDALKILDDLGRASSILTRYQEWPSRTNIDTRTDMAGFAEALELCKSVLGPN
jgi:hypothetical protein